MDGAQKGSNLSPAEVQASDAPVASRNRKLGHMTAEQVSKTMHPLGRRGLNLPNNFPHPLNGDAKGFRVLNQQQKDRLAESLKNAELGSTGS